MAGIEDIPIIRSMAEVVFRDTYRSILTPDQLEYMLDWMYSPASLRHQMEEGHVFFIEEGRGYTSIRPEGFSPDGTNVFHLEKLYVMPDARGTGLGRRLFETAITEARVQSGDCPSRVELNVNRLNPSKTFYEHMGMAVAREGDFPIGHGYYMNDYIMTINL